MTYEVEINGRVRRVEVERAGAGYAVALDGRRHAADVTVIDGMWSLILSPEGAAAPRRSYEITIDEDRTTTGRVTVQVGGRSVAVSIGAAGRRGRPTPDEPAGIAGSWSVKAPMPGRVVKVLVRAGETVTARQGVVVVEAMKMENELRSPGAGRVAEVLVTEGVSVDAGAVLVVIEQLEP